MAENKERTEHRRATDGECPDGECLAQRQVSEAVLTTKVNGIIALSGVAVGLLAYSVFWQAPTIKEMFKGDIVRLEKVELGLKNKQENIELRVHDLELANKNRRR